MIQNKKAQEEIVGFVTVVVIVVVILVVFLGIIIRQKDSENVGESRDVYQFLESVVEYTSECALGYEPNYVNLGELIQKCYLGANKCISGDDPCDIFNKTLIKIIETSFLVGEESSVKGYEFESFYSTNAYEERIILIKKGNCLDSVRGAEVLIPAFPGTIANSLKLCYT